ncbi:MAG: amidophosphoribosyltransferase [Crocinitomicaceae bacterium]|nr:amidophosphoribosyltransferase [Crocinitomicaceae bacterium]
MSDFIKHECGVALVRLLKPLDYYVKKYGTPYYGLNKMYLLMEKQHNRGQDGAGIANIKLDVEPGKRYISRYRSISKQPIQDIFQHIHGRFEERIGKNYDKARDPYWLKDNAPFSGELFLGHLRYGTYGKNSIEACHPFLRQNNWKTRNLVVAGNFNMTNVDEQFDLLINLGQHPKQKADTVTVLEKIGHFLDVENEAIFQKSKMLGYSNREITERIIESLDLGKVLRHAAEDFDGGYVMCGLVGHGDAFVLRDPNGIRPVFHYQDDEVVVVASERPAIQTAFNLQISDVKELDPGNALLIRANGKVTQEEIRKSDKKTSCSFERIYFSRGSDTDIYQERKELGRSLTPLILKSVNHDIKNTVFSFIPNTAETSFYGMLNGIEAELNQWKKKEILKLGEKPSADKIESILSTTMRVEKLAIKDAKLRTFITQDADRDDLVEHVYDVTYGVVNPRKDNIVVIDDSIVRGTTLKKSIIRMLDRLKPKKIVIVSSAPQIRFPDCYGIDMARMSDFIAFRAALALLVDRGKEGLVKQVYKKAKAQLELPMNEQINVVNEIYEPFTAREISDKIAELVTPPDCNAKVEIIFQTIEGLHVACPNHAGDWYFTGNFPTPGGIRVVNKAFVLYYEGSSERAY